MDVDQYDVDGRRMTYGRSMVDGSNMKYGSMKYGVWSKTGKVRNKLITIQQFTGLNIYARTNYIVYILLLGTTLAYCKKTFTRLTYFKLQVFSMYIVRIYKHII